MALSRALLVLVLLSSCRQPDPALPSAGRELAAVLERCGGDRHREAAATLDAYVAAHADSPDAHSARATCAWAAFNAGGDAGEIAAALDDYDRAVRLAEAGRTTTFGLDGLLESRAIARGVRALDDGGWSPVIDDLDRAIALRPTARRYVDRGAALVGAGDGRRAAADFDRARAMAAHDAALLREIDALEAHPETAAILAAGS